MQLASLDGYATRQDGASTVSHHMLWLGAGYGLGIALVVPIVLWITEPSPARRARPQPVASQPILVEGPKLAVRRPAAVEASDARSQALDKARELIGLQRLTEARAAIVDLSDAGDGEANFLLAQTYDPVQLAAQGVLSREADVERARHLYGRALAAGIEAARIRIEQLKQ